MAIKRQTDRTNDTPTFQVGLNITLTGSKKMTPEQQDRLMEGLTGARVIIVHEDADVIINPGASTLVDRILPAVEFSTGSVGFKLHDKGFEFS
jgi:hypothetical protein